MGDYWYNLDTGAMVFITAERDARDTQETGRLRVWSITPGARDEPVEVTGRFCGRDSRYVESINNDRNLDGRLRTVAATRNDVIGIDRHL